MYGVAGDKATDLDQIGRFLFNFGNPTNYRPQTGTGVSRHDNKAPGTELNKGLIHVICPGRLI
jgi:hypothetical protein